MPSCLPTISSQHRSSTLVANYFRWLQQLAAGLFEASAMRFPEVIVWHLAFGLSHACIPLAVAQNRSSDVHVHLSDAHYPQGHAYHLLCTRPAGCLGLPGWVERNPDMQTCAGTLLGNPCPASDLLKSFSSDDWVLDKLGCSFTPHGKACLQLLCTDNAKASKMCHSCSQAMSLCSSVRL